MYEHPYLSRQISLYEQEQIERATAQRRFLIEHADQIVPRPEGAVRRMLRRVFRRPERRTASTRTAAGCEPTAAAAR